VLDAFSRRVIGWALEATLEARLAVAALEMALERRRPAPGLVHHSDQGVQYVSYEYVALLESHQVRISHVAPRQSLGQGLCFILHLLRTLHDVLWEAAPF
jgi:transposase InsO family protein